MPNERSHHLIMRMRERESKKMRITQTTLENRYVLEFIYTIFFYLFEAIERFLEMSFTCPLK